MPEAGRPFNPYRMFRGAWVPEALLRNTGVSTGAAVLYGLLGRFAGAKGHCWPRQELLANELAVTERTVRRRLAELTRLGLIEIKGRTIGRNRTVNSYFFLWNTLLESGQMLLGERTQTSGSNRTLSSGSAPADLMSGREPFEPESSSDGDRAGCPQELAVENSSAPESFERPPAASDDRVLPSLVVSGSDTRKITRHAEPQTACVPSVVSPRGEPPQTSEHAQEAAYWRDSVRSVAAMKRLP